MTDLTTHQELCRRFAALLSYPDAQTGTQAAACLALLEGIDAGAAETLRCFVHFAAAGDLRRLEEAFTDTFDLQAVCHPYVGYQLCGESQQRTLFLLKLRELYRRYDFGPGSELPDHLTEILRFLAVIDDQGCRGVLIRDGLLPALAKIAQGLEDDDHPYLALLRALREFLAGPEISDRRPLQPERSKECLS